MLEIREEELNMVNGGTVFGTVFGEFLGGSKFNIGDRVMSKSNPDLGVVIVVGKAYNEGWWYRVAIAGTIRSFKEDDLEDPIVQ